jgi:electron transfer flavoprotein beta subunit
LVDDVFQAFYTNEVSWVWLGYDGPPMPDGYPNLSEGRSKTKDPETTPEGLSPYQFGKPLRILVCLKQVPDKDSHYTIDDSGYEINEKNLTFEINESDLYALEEALRLKANVGGEVVVLSLGEGRVVRSLKDGLARGADRAIHVNDPVFRNIDAFVTAKAIAASIRNEEFDIVLTGVESGDFGYGQTGIILAQLLGWPYATIVVSVDIGEDLRSARVKRELESNAFEWVDVPLPAVLTIQTGINEPRYVGLKGILQARKKEIRTLSARELGLRSSELGRQGSKIDNIRLFFPEKKKNTVMLEGSTNEVAKALIEKLHNDANVL